MRRISLIAAVVLAGAVGYADEGRSVQDDDGLGSRPKHWEKMAPMMEKAGEECPSAPITQSVEKRVITDKNEEKEILRKIGAAVIEEVQSAPESFHIIQIGMDDYGFVINVGAFWRKALARDHINMETVSGSGFRMVWQSWYPQMWIGNGKWDTVGFEDGFSVKMKDGKATWPVRSEEML